MAENGIGRTQQKIYTYFERNPELKVLFIFSDPFIEEELHGATWKEGYRYVVFQGDWFTCKYLLDTEWKDDKIIFYFDMGSPLQDKKVKENFPLLDVLVANMVYHHEDYVAFMQQYNLPQDMATFVDSNITLLQSSKMITLLEPYYSDSSINEDIATRGFLSMFLAQQRVLEWDDILIRVLLQGRSSERKKQGEFYKKLQSSRMILDALNKRFVDIFGVTVELNTEAKVGKIVQAFKYNAIVQKLAPVDADNYTTNRISNSIALEKMNRMLGLIMSQPKYASAFEELITELGATIRCDEIVKWYGAEADFYYIPEELLIIILQNILTDGISDEPQNIVQRIEPLIIKQGDNATFGEIMDFIVQVARYYEKVSSLVHTKLYTPNDYIQFYENEFFQIDYLYRYIIELYYKLSPTNVLFEKVQSVKKSLDQHYAKTTNRINLNWSASLKEAGGFNSLSQPRQWDFYNSQIKPIQKKVAVIVCDALRYEMAKQLIGELGKSKHVAKLYAGIATLPTETKFCKPSLLPHKTLKLYGSEKEQDMSVDDKILSDTEKRSAQLQAYKANSICVPFDTIAEYNQEKNREIFKHECVYIFHNSIDESGHSNSAKKIVSGCAQAIKELATMIPKIHASYNVTEIYLTSDHGFLFNDIEFKEKDKHKITEELLEQKSRYYLTKSDADIEGIVKYPFNEVSGISNVEDVKVAVPQGTNRFAAPSGGYMFAHGGASLQEIVIPIIVSRQERTDNKKPVDVMVLGKKLSIQASRIRFALLQTEAVNMDTKERVVTVALYDNDNAVTPIKQYRLDKTDAQLDNRRILVDLTLNKNVDANVLQLKVYDMEDENNPLIKENVVNNTLIEPDF